MSDSSSSIVSTTTSDESVDDIDETTGKIRHKTLDFKKRIKRGYVDNVLEGFESGDENRHHVTNRTSDEPINEMKNNDTDEESFECFTSEYEGEPRQNVQIYSGGNFPESPVRNDSFCNKNSNEISAMIEHTTQSLAESFEEDSFQQFRGRPRYKLPVSDTSSDEAESEELNLRHLGSTQNVQAVHPGDVPHSVEKGDKPHYGSVGTELINLAALAPETTYKEDILDQFRMKKGVLVIDSSSDEDTNEDLDLKLSNSTPNAKLVNSKHFSKTAVGEDTCNDVSNCSVSIIDCTDEEEEVII